MAYNLKYFGQFDSFKNDVCMYFEVQILQNNYEGSATEILLSGTPAIQEWQDDERNKPIKGSTLKVGIINNGIVSLESFYSNYDDEFQVILRQRSTDKILFIGYIIQDECSEILTSLTHEISITATDMLGSLKDIKLDEANNLYPGATNILTNVTFSAIDTVNLWTNDSRISFLKPNDKIVFENGPYNGEKTVLSLGYNSIYGYGLTIDVRGWPAFSSFTTDIVYSIPIDLSTYQPLNEIIRICLQATKLELGTNVISQFHDVDGDTNRFLESTCLIATTFSENGQWMSCYDVLEMIFSRFRATLFQSKGLWWIIRINELFQGFHFGFTNSIDYKGYFYDYRMSYYNDIDTNTYFKSFENNDFEYGALKSIERPIGYTKDTFNYNQPDSLLNNQNLDELGDLIEVTTYGSGTSLEYYYEYEAPYWVPWDAHPTPAPDARIRVVKDYLQAEKERYLVLTGDGSGSIYDARFALQSNDIILSKNDIINFSFSFRTDVSQSGPITLVFEIRAKDGINADLYIDSDGFFQSTGYGFVYNIPSGDNTNEWHTVSINSRELPNDCLVNLYLAINTQLVGNKTYYKDFDLKINSIINNNGTINGQQHTYTNLITLNNIIETDIKLDTSPSSVIAGTLFLDNSTGIIRNKSQYWAYSIPGGGFTGYGTLGSRILAEEMFIRYKPRYKYEGNLLNVYNPFPSDYIIGPETSFNFENQGNNVFFVFGKLSIDYKNGMADCTMLGIGDIDDDIINIYDNYLYEFNYLYENN